MVRPARQHPVELILLRQLAARLTTPVALFDSDGRLIYVNAAAETVFGVDFAAIGELSLEQVFAIAQPTDVNGGVMTPDTAPVTKTLKEGRPAVGTVSVRDPHGGLHRLTTMTVPVQGHRAAIFGAMSLFWKLDDMGLVATAGPPRPRRL
jgi:PAS domain-containing protein